MNIQGKWHNSNTGSNNDIVNIYLNGNDLFIIGHYGGIQYFGYVDCNDVKQEYNIGDKLNVTWTDTYNSSGTEVNKVHHSIIKVKNNNELVCISDKYLNNKPAKGSFCKPSWIRP